MWQANLGAKKLYAASQKLENALKQGNLDQVAYESFQAAVLETRDELNILI